LSRLGRRALLGLGGALGVSACGFRPLYAPVSTEDGGTADIRDELAAVRVANIPERTGQILRRDLQRRFEGVRLGVPARYALQVAVTYSVEPLGYRRDGTITRLRYVATGNWSLATLAVPPRQIASSPIPTRALDSFNVPDLQFFAADSARDAMDARLAEQLSEEIFRRVAMELRRERLQRRDAGAAG
jgi:LPS-assembly lipoprotein